MRHLEDPILNGVYLSRLDIHAWRKAHGQRIGEAVQLLLKPPTSLPCPISLSFKSLLRIVLLAFPRFLTEELFMDISAFHPSRLQSYLLMPSCLSSELARETEYQIRLFSECLP